MNGSGSSKTKKIICDEETQAQASQVCSVNDELFRQAEQGQGGPMDGIDENPRLRAILHDKVFTNQDKANRFLKKAAEAQKELMEAFESGEA